MCSICLQQLYGLEYDGPFVRIKKKKIRTVNKTIYGFKKANLTSKGLAKATLSLLHTMNFIRKYPVYRDLYWD